MFMCERPGAAFLILLATMTITALGCSARQEAESDGRAGAGASAERQVHARPLKRVDLPLDHERYMRAAIEQASNVPELPFGAVLVDSRSGEIVAEGFNRSKASPTFHGEIDVINRLAASEQEIDWPALVLYTTAEPCPMCQGGGRMGRHRQRRFWDVDRYAQATWLVANRYSRGRSHRANPIPQHGDPGGRARA